MILLLALGCVSDRAPVFTLSPAVAFTDDPLTAHLRPGEDAVTWAWLKNGVFYTERDRIETYETEKGQRWTLQARRAGIVLGERRLLIRNTPPEILTAALPPEHTVTDEVIVSGSTTDADGDPVEVFFAWEVDGVVVQEGRNNVFTGPRRKNTQISVTITPTDGEQPGAVKKRSTVFVNSAPVLDAAAIVPTPFTEADTPDAHLVANDVDGDVLTEVLTWEVNGVPGGVPKPGDLLSLTAQVSDGEATSEIRSAAVVVVPTPPPVRVSIDPVPNSDALRCHVDTGSSTPEVQISWSTGDLGSLLPASAIPTRGPLGCRAVVREGSAAASAVDTTWVGEPDNLLLVLADDLGIDKVAAYEAHPAPPPTPILNALATDGMLFRNAYTNPTCSPSRAAVLTGRHNRRYGTGLVVHEGTDEYLPLEEELLPQLLSRAPTAYSSGVAGKWHLSGWNAPYSLEHPLLQGFLTHRGAGGNLQVSVSGSVSNVGYRNYEYFVDGTWSVSTTYATTQTVDDAVHMVNTLPEPWFVHVAFNAPHKPFHEPPSDLHTQVFSSPPTTVERFNAMVEAMDTELGRLLDAMPPHIRTRTTVVFMGDNGTIEEMILPPLPAEGHGKKSLFEGGVRVPLIIHASWLPPAETDSLVQSLDLFPTFAEIAGATPSHVLDGTTLMPLLLFPDEPHRDAVLIERLGPNGPPPWNVVEQMVSDGHFKLIRTGGEDALYDLSEVPHEGENLLEDALSAEASAAYGHLDLRLDQHLQMVSYDW